MSNKQIVNILKNSRYKHPEHTRRDIVNVTKLIRTLTPRLETYTFPTGASRELICLDGTIPINFRNAQYNIPIGIFISEKHPFEAPICYVRPTKTMKIQTSRHVDGSGRIYLPYLSQWDHNRSDILCAIQVMQVVFGQECPVYQKSSSTPEESPRNVTYPPPLPDSFLRDASRGSDNDSAQANPSSSSISPVYPFSSQPQSRTTSNATGTITEEHIRASLLSAVEDRLKQRLREKVHQIQDEIEVLKKTSSDLNRGKNQLDEMKARMTKEVAELIEAKKKLQELDDQLKEFIIKYDEDGEEIDPDEVYGPTQPLFKQLLDAFAEENALVDAIYYTGEGLRKGVIPLDVFLKSVRELSRRQFMLRALMRACRAKASLPN